MTDIPLSPAPGADDIAARLAAQDQKLDKIYRSVESTRRYFMWTLIISVIVIVLPLIGLFFAIPAMLSSFDYGALGL